MSATKEEILNRMLELVPDTFDKREGSVIYDALAPVAYEFEQVLADYEKKLKNTFAGTADREHLIQRCAEIGIVPFPATHAVRQMRTTPTTLDIAIGERFIYGDLFFTVIKKVEDGLYNIECETSGSEGNYGAGSLIPVEYISGLETATLIDGVLVYGEDEEDTEALRQRYFKTLPTMTLDGNVAQYSKWCREFAGVGEFKIFPCWNGVNTVKVSILSSENTVASQELIDSLQEFLDPNQEGLGMGKAPIGATVTVSTATFKLVDVVCRLTLQEGYTEPYKLEEAITEYLKSINYKRDFVSTVAIAAIVQNCEGVDVVYEVTVNGSNENIPLGNEEIAELNSVNVEVA